MTTREVLLERGGSVAHVIGAVSAEGVATARLLESLGFQVVLHDLRPPGELRAAFRITHSAYSGLEQDGLWESLRPLIDSARLAQQYLTGIRSDSTVVLGQGWYLDPANRAAVAAAIPEGTFVTSMTALYFALAPGPIAAVTGTNGKSTTVALIDHLLAVGEVEHNTAGNERSNRQFLPEIESLPAGTLSLLEVSNRQLLQLARSPQVGAITALTPDHLEEHGGLEGYHAAKRRLFERQAPGDVAVVNADDAEALQVASVSAGTLVRCGLGEHAAPSVSWIDGELVAVDIPTLATTAVRRTVVAREQDLTIPGTHNRRNAAVAVGVALACGVDPARIAEALRTFAGKSLRLEPLGELAPGVDIWSDIKSTTPEATMAALEAFAGRRVLLVVGGTDKGLDYGTLADALIASAANAYAVPGSATERLADALASRGHTLERVDTLTEALERARDSAEAGDVVIVSPAAAGFWTTQLQGKPSLRSLVRRYRAGVPTG